MACSIHITLTMKQSEKENYSELLNTYVRNERQKFPENTLFRQDLVTAHTTQDARAFLRDLFEENGTGTGLLDHSTLCLLIFSLGTCEQ